MGLGNETLSSPDPTTEKYVYLLFRKQFKLFIFSSQPTFVHSYPNLTEYGNISFDQLLLYIRAEKEYLADNSR